MRQESPFKKSLTEKHTQLMTATHILEKCLSSHQHITPENLKILKAMLPFLPIEPEVKTSVEGKISHLTQHIADMKAQGENYLTTIAEKTVEISFESELKTILSHTQEESEKLSREITSADLGIQVIEGREEIKDYRDTGPAAEKNSTAEKADDEHLTF